MAQSWRKAWLRLLAEQYRRSRALKTTASAKIFVASFQTDKYSWDFHNKLCKDYYIPSTYTVQHVNTEMKDSKQKMFQCTSILEARDSQHTTLSNPDSQHRHTRLLTWKDRHTFLSNKRLSTCKTPLNIQTSQHRRLSSAWLSTNTHTHTHTVTL